MQTIKNQLMTTIGDALGVVGFGTTAVFTGIKAGISQPGVELIFGLYTAEQWTVVGIVAGAVIGVLGVVSGIMARRITIMDKRRFADRQLRVSLIAALDKVESEEAKQALLKQMPEQRED